MNPAWIPEWKAKVDRFWQDNYRSKATDISSSSQDEELSTNLFVAHLQSKKAVRAQQDEYVRYIGTPVVDHIQRRPVDWWLEPSQQKAFPFLSQMAIDILSIPGSSADVERLFSSSKLTCTDQRNRLGIKLIEALEQLKSWMKLENWFDDDEVEWDD